MRAILIVISAVLGIASALMVCVGERKKVKIN